MRITNGMQIGNMLRSLQGSNERSTKLQEQLSSGRRINRPSDDPVGVSRSLKFNRNLSENDQYTRNIKDAMANLDATDTALDGAGTLLHRLKDIAIYGSDGSLPKDSLFALGKEVDEILGQLVQLGNTSYSGTYVFSGEKVLTQPYALNTAVLPNTVTYAGNNGAINYEIAPGVNPDKINLTGPEVFDRAEPAAGTLPASNNLFQRVIQLRDELLGATTNVGNLQILEGGLDKDLDQLLNCRAVVGAKYNKMELSLNRSETNNITITKQIASNDDTDIAKATMDLKMEENVYNAALAVGARIIPQSLVDFLR